ncbi:uncharacterized protein Z520_04668 [Fonsecaea multimorphosa CBS 102226]|uniref:DUF8212 domain-containing protein n=1 Tax=Fonsecaea multimorphosa CBS 102226 TaxID=1442371 RepID=A0A0D2KA42_9EURO|nr:uncharacterized protein Z520_04668 [Fonsecaea multimorphosa CBS 102226]KIY00030.1 hypothetical protein Z520_04668 [Fonsecaea multimorphosa CBS 102226]OAL26240.1 hypothetical protein AYO22_04418 [Fonsecaea multimorphosa]
MFGWYSQAHVCYAYLDDVALSKSQIPHGFASSKWFTRGWTLQELIAPTTVEFYDKSWSFIGTKGSLLDKIAKITAISYEALTHPRSVWTESIAERMSWAASRTTTKDEDGAYCLMGIFDVNMPLLYGEGMTKAFRRLQMQIMVNSGDLSIFAWKIRHPRHDTRYGPLPSEPCGVLTSSPKAFLKHRTDTAIVSNDNVKASAGPLLSSLLTVTNLGLSVSLPLLQLDLSTVAVLNCQRNGKWVGIHVHLDSETGCYYRKRLTEVVLIDSSIKLEQPQPIYLSTDEPSSVRPNFWFPTFLSVIDTTNSSHPYKITRIRDWIFEGLDGPWSSSKIIAEIIFLFFSDFIVGRYALMVSHGI